MKKELVGFDVDSTTVDIEGLNWLAERKGVGDQVAKLTEDSMNGNIPVEEAMSLKMDAIHPSRDDMQALADKYRAHITPDAIIVVQQLQKSGKQVVLITGNFHEAVDPLAATLGIPLENVFANNLSFNEDGSYQGHIENFHLMHDDGKQQIVSLLKQKFNKVTHVGDSMGDLLADADIFIGYGGVVLRRPVLERSNLYIPGNSLAPVLAVELSRRQLRNVADKSLVHRAQTGLFVRIRR